MAFQIVKAVLFLIATLAVFVWAWLTVNRHEISNQKSLRQFS